MGAATLTVPTIFQAFDKFSGPLRNMSAETSRFARKLSGISNAAYSISRSTAVAGVAIATPMYLAAKSAATFEDNMSKVATLVDTNKESMSAMGEQVLKTYRDVPVTLEDLTHGLYQVRSAGIPATLAMDDLTQSAKLGVAGLATTTEATDVLTSAINVFKDEGLSATQISGSLFETVKSGKTTIAKMSEAFGSTAPIIHAAGVTLNDFNAATAAMTILGTPASQAMNEIRAAVSAMEKPSKGMAQIFKSLGVKKNGAAGVQELIHHFGNLGNTIQAVEDRGAKLHVNLAKAWHNTMALGAVTDLTGMSKDPYAANLLNMKNGVSDYLDAYEKRKASMVSQLQLLENNFNAFKIAIGTKLLPVITKLVDKISPVIDGIIEWTKVHPDLTKNIALGAASLSAFLLAASPVAGAVGLVANLMRIYTIATATATTATAAATLATTAQTTAVGALGTTVSAVTGELALAETAAAGFFSTLSSFVLPASLAALAGLALYKTFSEGSAQQQHGNDLLNSTKTKFNRKTPDGLISPFANAKEESAFQAWWLQNAKKGDRSGTRDEFDKAHHDEYFDGAGLGDFNKPKKGALEFTRGGKPVAATDTINVHVTLNDPGNAIKGTTVSGTLPSTVKITTTTANGFGKDKSKN